MQYFSRPHSNKMEKSQVKLFALSPFLEEKSSSFPDFKRGTYSLDGDSGLRKIAMRRTFSQWYIVGFTSIYYYNGLLPFRLVLRGNAALTYPDSSKSEEHAELEAKAERNSLQNALCIFMTLVLLCSICALTYLILYDLPLTYGRRPSFIEASLILLGVTVVLYHVFTAWCRPQSLEWLLANLSPNPGEWVPYSYVEHLQNVVAVICPALSILVSQFVHALAAVPNSEYLRNIFGEYDQLQLIVQGVIFYALTFVGHINAVIFQAVVLSFRDRARQFIQVMRNEQGGGGCGRKSNCEGIIDKFGELETFVDEANERFGGWIFIVVIFSVPFYSKMLAELLKWKGTFSTIFMTIWYMTGMSFWLLTAASNGAQVCNEMKKWLNANHASIPIQQLTVLTSKASKVTHDGIALRGGNFFAITFCMIGSLVSLVITWTFIDHNN